MTEQAVVVEDTGIGQFQMRVKARGWPFLVDEPASDGGLSTGPTPYDLLCAALGSCTAMTLRMYARRKAIGITRVEVAVTHRRHPVTHRDIFERSILLEGGFDEAQLHRMIDVVDRCPVSQTLSAGAEIITTHVPTEVITSQPIDDDEHVRAMEEACEKTDLDWDA